MNEAVLLNQANGTLHRNPASEACNLDAVRAARHALEFPAEHIALRHKDYRKDCRRCWRSR